MADRKPLKLLPDGGGDSTGLGEFVAGDTLGVVDGGTGLAAVGANQILTGHNSSTTGALTSEANLTFTGSHLGVSGTIGVGSDVADATQGVGIHICTADASATVNASNDELILEGNTSVGMSLLTDSDGVARITWGHGSGTDAYSGQIGYYNDGDYMNFLTASTERMRITNAGLTFNGDTAAANALDDYEEGTWTPVWKFGGASGTANTQTDAAAWYTKIGSMVTVWYRGALANSPSGSGSLVITGLPYTIQNTTNQYPGTGAWSNKIAFGDGLVCDGNPNGTFVNVEKLFSSTSTGVANVQHSDCTQYSQIRFILQYTV